jgi:hypothetical protein
MVVGLTSRKEGFEHMISCVMYLGHLVAWKWGNEELRETCAETRQRRRACIVAAGDCLDIVQVVEMMYGCFASALR